MDQERPDQTDLDRMKLIQAALDAVPAYIAILDERGTVLAVNAGWRTYAGSHPLIGSACGIGTGYPAACAAAAGTEPDLNPVVSGLRQVLSGELDESAQEYACGEGEARSWFMVRLARVTGMGAVRVMVAQVNVTERRRAEEALKRSAERLRQAQKMEAIGQLAGGVAHDFNNILTAILGYSEIMLDRLDPASPVRGYAEQIKAGGERAAELTRQLLAFSRKQMLETRVVSLNEIVTDVSKMLRRTLGEDVQQVLALDSSLGSVRVDPGRMGQVIMNLAVNARDAMPRGGKLLIETSNVEIDEAYAAGHPEVQLGHYALLAVSDTGSGMDAATLAHVFEPFFTTKPVGKGTGLGLATVFGIVKQSGGHVWVYSEPGKGTTFRIYLPRVEAPAPAAKPGEAGRRALPRGTETILVVEDEDMIRRLAVTILASCGYDLLEAPSAEAALVLAGAETRTIHLLLTDVVMPGLNGVELAARLTAARPGLRTLFMSGYTGNVMLHHGVSTSNMAFLQKPFTQAVLAGKVREVLG